MNINKKIEELSKLNHRQVRVTTFYEILDTYGDKIPKEIQISIREKAETEQKNIDEKLQKINKHGN